MFNPHIHQQQQQQQQQQFHQHLRQLQQLFQQQPPPPPPPQPPPGHHVGHHHHQTPRAIPVPPQTAPPPRMVNLCQATQTTIITPNPMLQGAILMQQMQGNMRNFGMGGQQFRQFFAAGARSSLLGPVPMGMAIKSPIMGFPAARPFHPHHARYYNNNTPAALSSSSSSTTSTTDTAGHQTDRKRDNQQMAANSTNEPDDKSETDDAVGDVDGPTHLLEEELQEPPVKKLKESDEPKQQDVVKTVPSPDADEEVIFSEYDSKTDESQLEDGVILEDRGSTVGSDVVEAIDQIRTDEMHSCLSPSKRSTEDDQQLQLSPEEITQEKDASFGSPENREEGEEGVAEGANKFYCYLCSINCHNQQNFRSHMNSISHKQRMMEIQHMSNACLVTLLPRVQESLQGTNKDGENKAESKRWCATCHTHFTSSIVDHRRTEEHKLASRKAISSCTVCKKYFKTSQMFVEHLQSQEHRQKLQEGCESFAKLSDMDTDGFFLEEEEGSDTETAEDSESNDVCLEEKQDGWSSFKEVTLKDMACDEKYDPDTVYGSSFFVPVAGFICRLCHKFYHFESSGLHTHCKSRKHFENLKAYRPLLSQKGEAVESSRVSLLAEGSSRPTSEPTTDCSEKNSYCSDTGLESNLNSMQPIITLTRLKMQAESQEQEKEAEPNPASQDFITISAASTSSTNQELPSREEMTISQGSIDQGSLAELDAVKREEPDSEMAADAEGANEAEEEKEAPAAPGKKNGTGKAKGTSKRRSGRATNRR